MPEVKFDRRPQHDLNMVYDEDIECLTRQPDQLLGDVDVQQGRIFWLPSKEEVSKMASKEKLSNEGLWRREVRRGHSSGAIDEGIYSHPVVVVSRPKEDNRYVHFLLITSFNGKRLDQVYAKAKDFHAGRRTWYLPVAPTPSHPDAISKKTKKRFPTLALANGAVLRKNSYVDIRNIYKIDWTLLKEYTNPEASRTHVYRFERESCIKLLAKCKTLVEYEPGEQRFTPSPGGGSRQSEDESDSETDNSYENQHSITHRPRCSSPEPLEQPDFCAANIEADRIACPHPKAPPDSKERNTMEGNGIAAQFNETVVYYLEQFPKVFHLKPSGACPKQNSAPPIREAKEAMDRAWRDAKGVAAILIASV